MATKTMLQQRIETVSKTYKTQIQGFTGALEGFASANEALASIEFPEGTPLGDVYDAITLAIGNFRKYDIPVVENTSKNSEGTLAFDTTHKSYDAARKARMRFMRMFSTGETSSKSSEDVIVPDHILKLAKQMLKALHGDKAARKICAKALALAAKG